jgi:hypothetical protein
MSGTNHKASMSTRHTAADIRRVCRQGYSIDRLPTFHLVKGQPCIVELDISIRPA